MRVELDIFSGRPNPVWELDAPGSTALVTRLASLSEHAPGAVELQGLGYRGFVFHSETHTGRAWRGFIDTNGRTLYDPTFAVERLLTSHLPDIWQGVRTIVERILLGSE
ncbi:MULTISPECIES: hypothetical protein [unclassified Sphingomonas]|uniref:hypothetical protein n=1 Tax=unclassified Sphingomonas TaxID=196159 RepID=UPI0007002899|nr:MULTISPECIES: hypothetical protein [unclassified Sphingomonas]KQS48110.1 hypothetical protein ASG20_13320 [Sphingomonas sp. Leaf198]